MSTQGSATPRGTRGARFAARLLVAGALVAGCGGDGGEGGGGPDATEDRAKYSARLNGPSSAEPGDVVVLTLSNLGDVRDSYGLTVAPADAGAVGPRHLTVEPGRSAKLKVKVRSTPLTIEVESVGAGPGIDAFTIR